ncbi:pantothenate kinase 2-like isoform X1 [Papaver somniferum]|uniref:pantothenate kinase 2-like isoform X1 n=1 Tax=Papaver somniferum TaxID=3469 RepID=UPI000E7050F7|nr:pantothenate kinase 2-like isoform X1 [Papaver somniferum]
MAEILNHHVPDEYSERRRIQEDVPYLALDIGGSLIKLVYFSRREQSPAEEEDNAKLIKALENTTHPVHGGWLHFVKFETREINQCLDFIKFKQLHSQVGTNAENKQQGIAAKVKVTGSGAHKFADLFLEKIGVTVEKEDEMDCLAVGANFLLKVFQNEAFTFIEGEKQSVDIDENDLFPYLLVNIGSGVSIHKVTGDGTSEAVDGSRIGGIACWGLGRLLTKCKSFNEIVDMSKYGNLKRIDLFVEDTFGDQKYVEKNAPPDMNIGSFGKAISENRTLEDCKAEDISLSLLEMISQNIGQIASLNARIYEIKRIFFGGSFIKDNTCALETLSSSVHYQTDGAAKAMFLRHEGFVGALGALMSYENKHGLLIKDESQNVETTLKSTYEL